MARTRGRGETARRHWPMTALLVLSLGVWNSVQCVLKSHSSSHPRPPITIVSIPRDYDSPSDFLSSGEERWDQPGFGNRGGGDSFLMRNPRPDKRNAGQEERNEEMEFRRCQSRLTAALNQVCGGKFYTPNNVIASGEHIKGAARKRAQMQVIIRRVPRSVVSECCWKHCSDSYMLRYCSSDSRGKAENYTNVADGQPMHQFQEEEKESSKESGNSAEPDSTMVYPLMHLIKFFLERLVSEKQGTSSPSTEGQRERTVLSPQARTQDLYPSHAPTPSNTRSKQKMRAYNSHNSNNAFSGATNTGAYGAGAGYRGPNVPPFNGVRSPFNNVKLNDRNNPIDGFQEQGELSSERTGTAKNAVTSTLPSLIIPLGGRTNDYFPQDF